MKWTCTARWVFPVERPPLPGGTVTIEGERIVCVQPASVDRAELDLGNAVILPGLVNAHTHLDLTGLHGLAPPTPDFTAWLRQVIAHRLARTPEQTRRDIREGLRQSLLAGVTLLGDIASQGLSWDILSAGPVRAVVYHEVLGLPEQRARQALERLQSWLGQHKPTLTCRPGISPHAPYSVCAGLYRQVAALAQERHLPVATHLAESPAEETLLASHKGPLAEFLRDLGVWEPAGLVKSWDEVLQINRCVPHFAAVHGNYLQPGAGSGIARVICPRTRAAFGFSAGSLTESRLALGTDGLSSNPDLDLLAEARFLHQEHPDTPGSLLLRACTLGGAETLGFANEVGSLTAGKSADLVVIPLHEEEQADPHDLLLNSPHPVRAVLFRGRWIFDRADRLGPTEPTLPS